MFMYIKPHSYGKLQENISLNYIFKRFHSLIWTTMWVIELFLFVQPRWCSPSKKWRPLGRLTNQAPQWRQCPSSQRSIGWSGAVAGPVGPRTPKGARKHTRARTRALLRPQRQELQGLLWTTWSSSDSRSSFWMRLQKEILKTSS